ncbi:MAG: hypothetical protein CFH37_00905 [Alphaproteobacteria bacterium MarineAlpha9_Bin7]|nr:MAG: hypothetical protein CFH37_00905 [Alphaproteobacteria bacterium MarineAlpha9_Bin7]
MRTNCTILSSIRGVVNSNGCNYLSEKGLRLAILLFLLQLLPASVAAKDDKYHLSENLLVAARTMLDPRFVGTVIYIYEHSDKGAMGLIINRLMARVPAKAIAEQFKISSDVADIEVPIFWGGPVQISRAFILHSSDYVNNESKVVGEGVMLTNNDAMLAAILDGHGPTGVVFAMGYAGWGPGQLEGELFREDWINMPATPEFIFGVDPDLMWNAAQDLYSVEL